MSIAKAHIEQIAELISAMCRMANRKADVLFDARHTWSWCGKEMPEEQDSVGIYVEDLGLVLEEMRTFINSLLGPRADAFWCISDTNSNFLLDITELDFYTPLFQDDFSKIYAKLLAMKYVCVNFTLEGDDSRIQRDSGALSCWADLSYTDFYNTAEVTAGADSDPHNFDEIEPIASTLESIPQSLALKGVHFRRGCAYTQTPSGTWYDRLGVPWAYLDDRSPSEKEGSLIPVGLNPDGVVQKVSVFDVSWKVGVIPDWVKNEEGDENFIFYVDGEELTSLSQQDLIDIFTEYGEEIPVSTEMPEDPQTIPDPIGYGTVLRERFAASDILAEWNYPDPPNVPYWETGEYGDVLHVEGPALGYTPGVSLLRMHSHVEYSPTFPKWPGPSQEYGWGWSPSGGWVDSRWTVDHQPYYLQWPGSHWRAEGGWVPIYWPADMETRLLNDRYFYGWMVCGGVWGASVIKEVSDV